MMITLSPEDTMTLKSRLLEAENAYHALRMGDKPRVFVDQNGERVEFAVASADRLRAYIMELKASLGLSTGIIGPLNVWVL